MTYPQQPWGPQQPPPQWGSTPTSPQRTPAQNAILAIVGIIATCCVCGVFGQLGKNNPQPTTNAGPVAPTVTKPRVASDAAAPPRVVGAAPASADAGVNVADAVATADAGTDPHAAIVRAAARASEPYTDVVQYDDELRALDEQMRGITDPALRRDARAAAALISRRRREIRREADRTRREQAMRLALSAVCGDDPPQLSAWDGELIGAERYLRRTANDPDSIDVENCTQPVLTREHCWVTRCQVRGNNAFGARVLNIVVFSVGRAGILGAETAR